MKDWVLKSLGIGFSRKPSRVGGVGGISIAVQGCACISVDVGNGQEFLHEFQVIESPEATIILGRDFLRRFQSSEFDWGNHRVRLGSDWFNTEATLRGGGPLLRAGLVYALDYPNNHNSSNDWDINPELAFREREALSKLLSKYRDVFAIDRNGSRARVV